MAISALLAKIIEWLRAGYPQGVPDSDYVPLVALLSRRLSTDEIRAIATELTLQGSIPADKTDVGVIITKLTDEIPREADLSRVRDHLHTGGWPIDETWSEEPS